MSQDLKAECGWSATNKETGVEKWREQCVRIGEQDIQAAETWRGGPFIGLQVLSSFPCIPGI